MRTLFQSVLVPTLLFAACGKGDSAKSSRQTQDQKSEAEFQKKVAAAQQETEPKKVDGAVFGKTVGPFGKIAALQLGMPADKAKAAAPALFDAGGEPKELKGDDNLTYKVEIKNDVLSKVSITPSSYNSPKDLVVAAWGAGTEAKNTLGGTALYWFSPSTHTRAAVDGPELTLSYYVPFEELLGADPIAIAALPKPIIGLTPDDVKRDYPVKVDGDVTNIILAPTEWDNSNVGVFVMYSKMKKKNTDYSFEISDKLNPAAKDTALAAMKKKWGEPKEGLPYGSQPTDKPHLIFHKQDPMIEVSRTYDDSGWTIAIRQKDDACGGPCYTKL